METTCEQEIKNWQVKYVSIMEKKENDHNHEKYYNREDVTYSQGGSQHD